MPAYLGLLAINLAQRSNLQDLARKMKSVLMAFVVLMLYGSLMMRVSSQYLPTSYDSPTVVASAASYTPHKFERIDEVKKKCDFVLPSATELKYDSDMIFRIEELSFSNGDWNQDAGTSPILPYDDRGIFRNSSIDLVSFSVNNIDTAHPSEKSASVSGVLSLSRSSYVSIAQRPYDDSPQFQMWPPGPTSLTINVEGIYVEKDAERIFCMLGNTMLPSRESVSESDSSETWGSKNMFDSNSSYSPSLLQDDQILLVLHYPLSFTLTSRVIKGQMRSLNSKSNLKYFNEIHILSQFGNIARYEFSSEKFALPTCSASPKETNPIDIYKGTRFCDILQQVNQVGAFSFEPNWKCNSTDDFCRALGPFGFNKEINATDGGFQNVKLHLQNLNCVESLIRQNVSSAQVAAEFRVSPPSVDEYAGAYRSNPSNMTIAAEGIWNSSTGQLCMIGCRLKEDLAYSLCDSQITLYIPLSFSILQRSIVSGSFASINSNMTFAPLSFEKLVKPRELWNIFESSTPYYAYSKIEKAGSLLEQNEPYSFGTVIKKSLLKFPKLEDTESYMDSLSRLSEDLTLQNYAFLDPLVSRAKGLEIQLEILSLGPLFGRFWHWKKSSTIDWTEEDTPYHAKAQYTEKQLLMNVSAQITLDGESYQNFSALFLEGIYDPRVGKMYLIGCRYVRAPWSVLFESMDLERGLDCLINVVVSYPPTTGQWLIDPTAKISISSQRNDDDPLRFETVKLKTLSMMYKEQREGIASRMAVEGTLRILTLTFAVTCIASQLIYIKHNLDSVPFMSLVMLGVQALGYCIPLVTGAEALFGKMASQSSHGRRSYEGDMNIWFNMIDYAVKLLVITSFLLTLRLCQKVWKSRVRLLARAPVEKLIFVFTCIIHVTGYVMVLIIHANKTKDTQSQTEYNGSSGHSHRYGDWEIKLEEYMGLVQDFFLLPQVIGNILWQIDCKPLRKLYFIGITLVRLLPHMYDYIQVPVRGPYFGEASEFVNPDFDFFSKFGDVAIPATAVLLAVVVYIQQRWDYEKLAKSLSFGRYRLLPIRSKAYEKLPSKYFESELVSSADGNAANERRSSNEE